MFNNALANADLLLIIKNLKAKLSSFENGIKYQKMQEEYKQMLAYEERIIKNLKDELEQARRTIKRNRELWFEVHEDIIKEHDKLLKDMEFRIDRMYKKMIDSLRQRDEALDKLSNQSAELKETKEKLAQEQEKNRALTARINKDYTNSSKPSSMDPNHKVIKNSREKSGRKPGGQPGHIHYPRKPHKPTIVVPIEAPEEYLEDDNYMPTGRKVRKQLVRIVINTEVIEFVADEFRNVITGQRVHADFPEGINLDVNYDGTVKALAYMLNNDCYVSIDKVNKFIKDITKGEINISTGCISNLSRQFSKMTEDEREEIFMQLLGAPFMHGDFTFGRMNGKQATVLICATPYQTMYIGKAKKGNEGIEDSPLELYIGTVISDHEKAFAKCGSAHQECMQHIERYLKGSIENEPNITWSTAMLDWVKRAIKYWKEVNREKVPYSTETVAEFIREYDKIIETAKTEYANNPPGKYYTEGYNTYQRMYSERDNYQLFLKEITIPPTNNQAERDARKFKRKAHQVMSFRSQSGVNYFCDGLTVLQTLKRNTENVYHQVVEIFNRGMVSWGY